MNKLLGSIFFICLLPLVVQCENSNLANQSIEPGELAATSDDLSQDPPDEETDVADAPVEDEPTDEPRAVQFAAAPKVLKYRGRHSKLPWMTGLANTDRERECTINEQMNQDFLN